MTSDLKDLKIRTQMQTLYENRVNRGFFITKNHSGSPGKDVVIIPSQYLQSPSLPLEMYAHYTAKIGGFDCQNKIRTRLGYSISC